MTTISKQLLINEFHLPGEIINIIKDFTFYNIIDKTKKNKNKIISLINTTIWSPISYTMMELRDISYIFWLENDNTKYQYQCDFCTICGDYLYTNTKETNVICKCGNF